MYETSRIYKPHEVRHTNQPLQSSHRELPRQLKTKKNCCLMPVLVTNKSESNALINLSTNDILILQYLRSILICRKKKLKTDSWLILHFRLHLNNKSGSAGLRIFSVVLFESYLAKQRGTKYLFLRV